MPVHRSRYELERVLGRYGASDLAFVELDANASIQFAMHGRYVQLQLPLPDPSAARFTHTPSGRPRTVAAQERVYEQALREHWRALLLAVRGKLQTVESGISCFEDEFAGFLVAHHEDRNGRRKKPKAVNWLLGTSHTLAVALVAAFLVPASAVSAFALPPTVVDHLSAPFRGVLPDELGADDNSRSLALGRSDWSESEPEDNKGFSTALDDSRSVESETNLPKASPSETSPETGPPSEGGTSGDDGASETIAGESSSSSSPGAGSAPSGAPVPGNGSPGGGGAPPSGKPKSPGPPSGGDKPDGSGGPAGTEPEPGPADPEPGADPGGPPSEPGNDKDNGNHNGADNGNKNGTDNENGNDNGNHNGDDNGNHNGADNGAKAGDTGSGKEKGKPSAGQ